MRIRRFSFVVLAAALAASMLAAPAAAGSHGPGKQTIESSSRQHATHPTQSNGVGMGTLRIPSIGVDENVRVTVMSKHAFEAARLGRGEDVRHMVLSQIKVLMARGDFEALDETDLMAASGSIFPLSKARLNTWVALASLSFKPPVPISCGLRWNSSASWTCTSLVVMPSFVRLMYR